MSQSIHNAVLGRRFRPRIVLSFAILFLSLPCVAQAAMTIRDYQPKLHDRFYAGADRQFIGENFDWSGVGYSSDNKWVTMISPSYFVSAEHYRPSNGSTVTFYEKNSTSVGSSHSYNVASGERIMLNGVNSDLWLGKLSTPLGLSDKINYYPILSLASESSYLGKELFNYGLSNRVGRNTIDGFMDRTSSTSGATGRSMLYDYNYDSNLNTVGGDETFLQGGDSGGPSFTNWNGQLTLLGVHWFNAGDGSSDDFSYSGDTFVPHYISDIERRMTNETLTVIPEPSTLVLWLLAGAVGVGYGWQRKCRQLGSV
ncbi:MAG: PEP-CTERM sorting domain-containing protein [Pirellulaceae bacterium]